MPEPRALVSDGRSAESDAARAAEPAVTGTQAVFRALSIMQAFTTDEPALSGPEIAARFGYSVPTAHRLLRALSAEGFLVFDRATRTYSPGPEVLRLSGVVFARDNVLPLTVGSLRSLQALTGETAAFHWMMGHHQTCVQQIVGNEAGRTGWGVGSTYPLTRGAAGKAILLGLGPAKLKLVLADPSVEPPLRGRSALLAELDEARRRGYTQSVGEDAYGVASVAVPFVWLKQSLAAISIAAPAERFTIEQMCRAGRVLIEEVGRLRAAVSRSLND